MADNINQTLEDLIAAIELAVECCETGGSRGGQNVDDPPLASEDVDIGIDGQFPDQSSYNEAKCLAANAIYDQIKGQVDWLQFNGADLLAGGFGGITAGILVHFLAGPLGWAALAIEIVVGTLVGYLIAYNINFSDLQQNMDNVKGDAIQALYNAGSSSAAERAFIAVLEAGSPTITDAETGLIGIMLTAKMLNELFQPSPDTLNYVPPNPTTCTGSIQTWSFEASGQGWAFRDDSEAGQTAEGQWVSAREAWEIRCYPGSSTNNARGTIYLSGLSIAVGVGNSVQVDTGAPSDAVNTGRDIKVIYSDLSEYTAYASGSGSLTVSLDITEAGTIETIETWIRRNWGQAFDFTCDIEEVRVQ